MSSTRLWSLRYQQLFIASPNSSTSPETFLLCSPILITSPAFKPFFHPLNLPCPFHSDSLTSTTSKSPTSTVSNCLKACGLSWNGNMVSRQDLWIHSRNIVYFSGFYLKHKIKLLDIWNFFWRFLIRNVQLIFSGNIRHKFPYGSLTTLKGHQTQPAGSLHRWKLYPIQIKDSKSWAGVMLWHSRRIFWHIS